MVNAGPLTYIIHKKWMNIYKHNNISALRVMFKKFYFHTFFPSAPIFGHLLRCESLEVGDYVVGFRRLASTQNLTHE